MHPHRAITLPKKTCLTIPNTLPKWPLHVRTINTRCRVRLFTIRRGFVRNSGESLQYTKTIRFTHLQQMRSLPAWYWPFGPQRRGSSMMATPRCPLSARNEPSVDAVIRSTENTCGAVGIRVWRNARAKCNRINTQSRSIIHGVTINNSGADGGAVRTHPSTQTGLRRIRRVREPINLSLCQIAIQYN